MAKKTKRDLWIIEFTSIDPSRDSTVAYDSRQEAMDVAASFVKDHAKEELERFEWGPEDEAPGKLKAILGFLKQGKKEDALLEWLDYQGEYNPDESIAIGPSGSVSDSPWDFPRAAK